LLLCYFIEEYVNDVNEKSIQEALNNGIH